MINLISTIFQNFRVHLSDHCIMYVVIRSLCYTKMVPKFDREHDTQKNTTWKTKDRQHKPTNNREITDVEESAVPAPIVAPIV